MPIPQYIVKRQAWRLENLPTSEYTGFCDTDCVAFVGGDGKPIKHGHSPAARIRINTFKDNIDMRIPRPAYDSTAVIMDDLQALERQDNEDKSKREAKALEAQRNLAKYQRAKGEPVKSSEVAVRPDTVPTPFVNYKRPVASPKMEIEAPYVTDGGTVLPELPKHVCEFPEVIETKAGRFAGSHDNDRHDIVLVKDNSIFRCICGKPWYVRVRNVPFHAANYKGQKAFTWNEIHWYNFARRMDLRNREAK